MVFNPLSHSYLWYRRRPHADGSDIYNALLRCKPPSPVQVIWAKTIAIQGPGTGGRLCSPNLRFWRPALSIELHPYIYRPQRRYAPGFSQAFRGPGCGFRLYTLHMAQPLLMCRHTGAGHSCHRFRLYDRRAPHSFPVPRRSQQSGVVSFHRQLRVLWNNF